MILKKLNRTKYQILNRTSVKVGKINVQYSNVSETLERWYFRPMNFLKGTVEPLKMETLRDEQKCPSYRGVRLIEAI